MRYPSNPVPRCRKSASSPIWLRLRGARMSVNAEEAEFSYNYSGFGKSPEVENMPSFRQSRKERLLDGFKPAEHANPVRQQ